LLLAIRARIRLQFSWYVGCYAVAGLGRGYSASVCLATAITANPSKSSFVPLPVLRRGSVQVTVQSDLQISAKNSQQQVIVPRRRLEGATTVRQPGSGECLAERLDCIGCRLDARLLAVVPYDYH
jgi:hypothetical protein